MNISSKDFTPEESYAYEMGYKDALKEINIPMKMIEDKWNPSKLWSKNILAIKLFFKGFI